MSSLKKAISFVSIFLFSAIATAYLFLGGFVLGKNRTILYKIANHFGGFSLNPFKPIGRIPSISISELLQEDEAIRLLEPEASDGNVNELELIVLNQLIKTRLPDVLFEIGTFDGRTTLNMAANIGEQGKVFTLDLPPDAISKTRLSLESDDKTYIEKSESGSKFQQSPYREKIVQLFGDSAEFDFTEYLGNIDLVFVDGSHSYEYVINDSVKALSLLKSRGGTVVWHDYDTWNGVTNALDYLLLNDSRFNGIRRIRNTSLVILLL